MLFSYCLKNGILCYCESINYVKLANNNKKVTCVITNQSLSKYVLKNKGLVVTTNPRNLFYNLHIKLHKNKKSLKNIKFKKGRNTKIHKSALISNDCKIGNGVVIKENVVIGEGVTIQDNVFVDIGVVIGSEGILYKKDASSISRIPHAGRVIIRKGATILSNSVIVKSVHESQPTIIGENNLIGISSNIGHDVNLGKNCVVSGNCVIARGAKIGDNVFIGTSSFLREYVKVGKKAEIKVGSIVINDIKAGQSVSGNFAIDHRKNIKHYLKK